MREAEWETIYDNFDEKSIIKAFVEYEYDEEYDEYIGYYAEFEIDIKGYLVRKIYEDTDMNDDIDDQINTLLDIVDEMNKRLKYTDINKLSFDEMGKLFIKTAKSMISGDIGFFIKNFNLLKDLWNIK
ncbi:MAG: hypothetical protein LBT51_09155 [Fusobacteriaceae bacterium]|jgi:hypothetical protein|nr:hypothetical protein [Fusobacteriaceae bacterium]